ncbi:PREDICTED: uncharacterized protein LOC106320776 [Brassica oleracea var. oleracea]|uniref:uncharacterized protein LOC106320776 n=1 Tax=Brassica oleracea var. oleracea TaxID=109376 RepID=UPI0006A72FA0|nr:PREDICTED: uncharacterized protein LOC106320776 [Brassica oleracea var. oleracea]
MTEKISITTTSTSATTGVPPELSPYHLHPSYNPGVLITSVLLTHENYKEWSTELRNSLQAKQKLGFIDGTISKPSEDSPDLARWLAVNSMIVGWIHTSIDSKVRSTVAHVPDAHKLWESLKLRFSVKNGTRVHQLQDAIANCKQDGQSVLEYYGRLTKLWEELQNLKTICTCTCAAAADIEKDKEDACVHKFLFGLDDSRFMSIRSRITDEDPLPDLNLVYSRVIREEQNMITTRSTEQRTDALGFSDKNETSKDLSFSVNNSTPSRSRSPARTCTHCGRTGHYISEWFLVHGFPEWYLERQNNSTSGTRGGRGGRSNSNRGRGGRGRANATQASTSINADQIASLITLLQNQQSNLSSERLSGKTTLTDVIIDTGASHHMTGNLALLHDVHDISTSSVLWPNGRNSSATKQGTLQLSKDYMLHDVL